MSIENGKAVIIDDEGNISSIDDRGFSVGEELEISTKTQTFSDRIVVFAKKPSLQYGDSRYQSLPQIFAQSL